VLSILTGCASVTQGTTQSVKIDTVTASGQTVNGAECRVSNDRSETLMLSGQTVSVRRSGVNLGIECTQPGYPPASGQATSRVNAGMVGNILLGGVIGAAVDASNGSGFNYPTWMQLVFGEVRSFDRGSQLGDQVLAGIRLGTTVEVAASKPAAAETPQKNAQAQAQGQAQGQAQTQALAVASPPVPQVAPVPSDAVRDAAAKEAPGATEVQPSRRILSSPQPSPGARVSMDDLGALLPAKP
jgi:hypothetical protein